MDVDLMLKHLVNLNGNVVGDDLTVSVVNLGSPVFRFQCSRKSGFNCKEDRFDVGTFVVMAVKFVPLEMEHMILLLPFR